MKASIVTLMKRHFPSLSALLFLGVVSMQASAANAAGKAVGSAPNPDPRSRTIPELVCTGERTVTVNHSTLVSAGDDTPLRLRLRGNLLYVGQSANSEKLVGIINRTDTRRWTADNATLVLDDALQTGVWARTQLASTRITAVRCAPFDSSKR